MVDPPARHLANDSQFIGVIRSALTGKIYGVVNPDEDEELDSPNWLLVRGLEKGEADVIEMVKLPRKDYGNAKDMLEVFDLIQRLKAEVT
jgi:hypothetical protein